MSTVDVVQGNLVTLEGTIDEYGDVASDEVTTYVHSFLGDNDLTGTIPTEVRQPIANRYP